VKRWSVLLGRGGTVLLAIGMALFLVSLIPSLQLGNSSNLSGSINAAEWWGYDFTILAPQQTLTPQQTLHITVNTTGVINVTVVDMSFEAMQKWMNHTYPSVTDWLNVTYLDGFVKRNPTLIVWQHELNNGTISYDYVPTEVVDIYQMNMSLVVSNHGPNPVIVYYTGSVKSSVAPTVKVLTLSEFAIPIGVVLTLPWLNELARARRKRVKTKDNMTLLGQKT
jgi:hypothetical protein